MRVVLVRSLALSLVILGCGGSRTVPAPAAPAVRRAEPPHVAVAAPPAVPRPAVAPDPLRDGSPIAPWPDASPHRWPLERSPRKPALGRDETLVLDGGLVPLRTRELFSGKKSDFWSPCVRDFVDTQPEAARELLGEALSLFSTACTRDPAMRVEFRVPRAGRSARPESRLGLIGALERGTCELVLEAAYHGDPVAADRITVIADGVRWSSSRLDFDRGDGWEIATLPFTRSLARVVKRAIDARDTLLRFESATGYEDVVVSDEMKQDLRVMIEALDAINRP